MSDHHDLIRDQFTRQAVPFSTAPAIADEAILRALVEATGAGPEDASLDVACGPGLVVSAFARVVRHATGIDLTPAMIERGRELAAQRGLVNVSWRVGDVVPLPWPDASFSIVTSRYAFHHIPEPGRVLQEMVRVCQAGGMIAVADICVSEDPRKAERFNELEKLNDPTHFRALPLSEHLALFHRAGMSEPKVARYKLDFTLSRMQRALGYSVEAARATEERVRASIHEDMLGTDSRFEGGETIFSYPIAVLTSRKQVAA